MEDRSTSGGAGRDQQDEADNDYGFYSAVRPPAHMPPTSNVQPPPGVGTVAASSTTAPGSSHHIATIPENDAVVHEKGYAAAVARSAVSSSAASSTTTTSSSSSSPSASGGGGITTAAGAGTMTVSGEGGSLLLNATSATSAPSVNGGDGGLHGAAANSSSLTEHQSHHYQQQHLHMHPSLHQAHPHYHHHTVIPPPHLLHPHDVGVPDSASWDSTTTSTNTSMLYSNAAADVAALVNNPSRESTPVGHSQPMASPPSAASAPQTPSTSAPQTPSTSTAPAVERSPSTVSVTGAAIKLLVSNNVAGSIIGRSGQTISELQTASNTRLKLSQSGDFYPGTQDRVCLVQGETAAVKVALRLLLERMYMLHESSHQSSHSQQHQQQQQQASPWPKPSAAPPPATSASAAPTAANAASTSAAAPLPPKSEFTVRLLVPQTSCGMLIGKAGSNIKFMEENSGVSSVRLSAKDENTLVPTSERIITLTGQNVDSLWRCCSLVLDGLVANPDISQYVNMTTSYANFVPPPSPPHSTSSMSTHSAMNRHLYKPHTAHFLPPAPGLSRQGGNQHPDHAQHHPTQHHHHAVLPWGELTPSSDTNALSTSLNRRSASTSDLPSTAQSSAAYQAGLASQRHDGQMGDSIFHHSEQQATSSYNPSYSPIPMPPPNMGFSLSPHQQPVYLVPRQQPQQGHGGTPYLNMTSSESSNFLLHPHQNVRRHSIPESSSAPNALATQLEQSLMVSQQHHQAQSTSPHFPQHHQLPPHEYNSNNGVLTPQPPTMITPGCFNAQVLIPDSMVGSILGRGGRTLTELQMITGTRIRISQRGEYMPGTRSRIVTIRGPTGPAVWHAQLMMSQRMMVPPTASFATGASAPATSATGPRNVPPSEHDQPMTSSSMDEQTDRRE